MLKSNLRSIHKTAACPTGLAHYIAERSGFKPAEVRDLLKGSPKSILTADPDRLVSGFKVFRALLNISRAPH